MSTEREEACIISGSEAVGAPLHGDGSGNAGSVALTSTSVTGHVLRPRSIAGTNERDCIVDEALKAYIDVARMHILTICLSMQSYILAMA